MEDSYYNVVGNTIFETVFDNLQDGEYAKEPIEFGGAFCYFKRLENYSVVNNDEDLTEFIRQEKIWKEAVKSMKKTISIVLALF